MHQVYNGTPIPIHGMAEGVPYILPPGEVVEIHNDKHAKTLLENWHQRGLRAVKFNSDLEDLKKDAMESLTEMIDKAIADEKAHNLEQAKQGLRPAPTNKSLAGLVKTLSESAGVEMVYAPGAANPMLETLAAATRRIQDMKPSAARDKLAAAIDTLTEHLETGDAPDEEAPNAAVKGRAAARRRRSREG